MSSVAELYAVEIRSLWDITPSPENDDLYGTIEHDEQMEALIESIQRRGLEEPIIVTADDYILSGHRRYYAARYLGWDTVPVRVKHDVVRVGNADYHRILAEYNPQRIKRAGSLLKEALLRMSDVPQAVRRGC